MVELFKKIFRRREKKIGQFKKLLKEAREANESVIEVYKYVERHTSSAEIKRKIVKSRKEILDLKEAIDELVGS